MANILSGTQHRLSLHDHRLVPVLVVLLVALLIVGFITVALRAAEPIRFGTLVTDPSHAGEESRAGVKEAMMEVFWDRYEKSDGQFDATYAAELKQTLKSYQDAGMTVTLALGSYTPPSWIFSTPGSRYVNQDGQQSSQLNVVYNQKVRDYVARYYARINADLGLKNFKYVRLTSGGSSEMLYPDNGYWAFDANALGGSGRPSTLKANPLPNWKPGSASASAAQAAGWADWYVGGLADVTNWQINTLSSLGFAGTFQTLTPGAGVRPIRYKQLTDARLPHDDVMGVGAAWAKYYELLPNKGRVMPYVSSVADHSGSDDVCAAADATVALDAQAASGWSATRYIARIAKQYGLTVGGENVGYDQPPAFNDFYRDTGESGMMATSFRQATGCGLTAFYWAHDERFWRYGTLSFANTYARRIAALNAGPVTPTPTTTTATPTATGFVGRSGTQLTLDGKPFRFVGFNLFDAAATSSYKCGWWDRFSDSELDMAVKQMHDEAGATVLRFWAYQTYTKGGTDWSGIDRVITVAKKYGMKVLPALEDGPGYCTTGAAGDAKWKYQSDSWYSAGYKVPYGSASVSYRDYVGKVVTRYRDEPTILGWMMMNEADTSKKRGDGTSVLVDFATDIGTLIKSIDSKHLVTVGTQSNGASGATGTDFAAVYGVPMVDFGEAHDWSALGWGRETDPLPGSPDGGKTLPTTTSADCQRTYQASLGCSFAFAKAIGKPLVVGESGIAASDSVGRTRRASLMDGRLKAAFDNGAAGYLIWQWNKVVDTEKFDVLGDTGDPLLGVMKKYASTAADATPSATPVATARPSVTPTLPVTKTPIPATKPGDLNADSKVNVLDLSALLSGWGKSGASDLNGDGTTNVLDLSRLLSAWTT